MINKNYIKLWQSFLGHSKLKINVLTLFLCFTANLFSAGITLTISSSTNPCNSSSNGSITVSATGSTTNNYQYSLNSGAWQNFTSSTSTVISNLSTGSYTIDVRDDQSLTGTISTTLTTITASSLVVNNTCNSGSDNFSQDGTITITASNGNSPYSYKIGTGSYGSNNVFSNLAPNNYNVTILDNNSCTYSLSSITVGEASLITITNNAKTNVSCNGGSDGSMSLTISGGTGSTYQTKVTSSTFSTSYQTSSSISSLPAENYVIYVKDSKGCIISSSSTITQPSALTLSGSVTNVDCKGNSTGSVVLTAGGGTSPYTYKNGTGSYQASSTFSTLAAGSYTFTVKDANGCTQTVTSTVTEPAALTLSTTQTNVLCYGKSTGAINLTVTGGTTAYSYSWTGPSSFTATTQNINSLKSGSYTVNVTDAKSCSASKTVTLTQPATAVNATLSQTQISCNGLKDGVLDVAGNGGVSPYTYLWTYPNSTTATTKTISGLAQGTYNFTVTDANNCQYTGNATIVEPVKLSLKKTVTNALCYNQNGSVVIDTTGGTKPYNYAWKDVSSNTVATTKNLTNVKAGKYYFTVTDSRLCQDTISAIITQPDAIVISTVQSINVSCNGLNDGSITISATGGTTLKYSIDTGTTFQSSNSFSKLKPGKYKILVSDANSCKDSFLITASPNVLITEPNVLSLILTTDDVLCNGDASGNVYSNVSGGTKNLAGTYSYSWSGPASYSSTSDAALNVVAGKYYLTVTDRNNCKILDSAVLNEPTALVLNFTTNSVCNGDGNLTFSASGGIKPYTYTVDGTPSVSPLSKLADKNYDVIVTDSNGCTKKLTANLKHNDPFKPVVNTKNITVYLNSSGSASISTTDVDNGSSDNCGIQSMSLFKQNFNCNDTGVNSDTLYVTDINGNTNSKNFAVTVKDTISPTITIQNVTLSIDTSGSVTLTKVLAIVSQSDNCGIDTTYLSKTIFTVADAGTNTVIVTIKDKSGNTITKSIKVDVLISDSDKDSIPDYIEKNFDTDGDGIMNYLDEDSDNDAIPDVVENAGLKSYATQDFDGDGLPNCLDLDSDDDGINDVIEVSTAVLDADGDGLKDNTSLLISAPNNQDATGNPDYLDLDSDDDGLLDAYESQQGYTDADKNGVIDGNDVDKDGIKDFGDGNSNWKDAFDKRPVDTDTDGDGDWRDKDSDNDGISDATEGSVDTDGDNIPNYIDTDSDADGIPDKIEGVTDTDGDGKGNYIDTDSDADGIDDKIEGTTDTDGDGLGNYIDTDSDADGIDDKTEGVTDTDGDGLGNYIDTDSDADGIDDKIEGTGDPDGDGKGNYIDDDSDGDTIPDKHEKNIDTDGDGTPDYLDLDSDNDQLLDSVEGTVDVNPKNGKEDYVDAEVTIPEGFSPNGDNIDDLFDIKGLTVFTNAELTVFNRNGQIVFKSGRGYNNKWAGDCTEPGVLFGSTLPEGIYFYIFNYNDSNNLMKPKTGNIYIKR